MRRLAPRRLSVALADALSAAEPATALARIQSAWPGVAGATLTAATAVRSEREGVVTIACESAVWAQELELLAPELLPRLNAALPAGEAGTVARLRFVVGSGANQP